MKLLGLQHISIYSQCNAAGFGPFFGTAPIGAFPLLPDHTSLVERWKPIYTKCGVISLIIQIKLLSFPPFPHEANTMQSILPNHIRIINK